jgi:hypothetical protein
MLGDFKNKHSGETCLVIGNGPSLKGVDNSFLNKYNSFGCNGIFQKYIPTFYFYVDPDEKKIDAWKKSIEQMKCTKFIGSHLSKNISNCTYVNVIHSHGFSYTPESYIFGWFSSITVMLQMAYYMGFKTILLVGVDHKYKESRMSGKTYNAEQDGNHFTKNYYPPGTLWNVPDVDKVTEWLKMAKNIFENNRRKIINITPNSGLTVFEKGDIDEYSSIS